MKDKEEKKEELKHKERIKGYKGQEDKLTVHLLHSFQNKSASIDHYCHGTGVQFLGLLKTAV